MIKKCVFCVLGQHAKCLGCDCGCAPATIDPIVESKMVELLVENAVPAQAVDAILEVVHMPIIPIDDGLVECECCNNRQKELKKRMGMLMCDECYEKELALQAANNTPEKQQERVLSMNNILTSARTIDAQIQVRTDIFNANTVAIVTLKKAIDEDVTITNKQFRLAEELSTRFHILKTAIFELNEEVIIKSNEQRAIQTYLNQLSNSLRAEEREKLKLQDINYNPQPAKLKVSSNKPKKEKVDKALLEKYSKELGLPPSVLTMSMVAKNLTLDQAYTNMKKAMGK